MRLTRREMFQAAVAASVAFWPMSGMAAQKPKGGGGGGGGTTSDDYIPMHPDLAMTREAFKNQLNQYFLVHDGNQATRVRLVEVRDCPSAAAAGAVGSQSCFTLFFAGALDEWLPDGNYVVETPSYGKMELFLKRATVTTRTARYEVAFNRVAQ